MVVYVFPFFLDCSMMGLRQALSKRVLQGAKVPQTRLTIFTWLDSFAVLIVNVFLPLSRSQREQYSRLAPQSYTASRCPYLSIQKA
jgi:hypothetical protein